MNKTEPLMCDCGLYALGSRPNKIVRGVGREGVHRPAGPEGAAPLCYVLDQNTGVVRWLPPFRVHAAAGAAARPHAHIPVYGNEDLGPAISGFAGVTR